MLASRHHPEGGARLHCDNVHIETAIANYQANRDLESLSEVVALTQDRALTLIRFYRTTKYRSRDELLSDVNFKLIRAVDKFDPEKGSAFTFVSQVIANALFTAVSNTRRNSARHRTLSKVDLDRLVTNGETESEYAIDDLAHRVRRGVKTTLENSKERDVQRWLVASFCNEGFSQCRHQCADAAIAVYGVNHARSENCMI
jgi:DNA-directed RNA polymerase specialized sigma24 family protein